MTELSVLYMIREMLKAAEKSLAMMTKLPDEKKRNLFLSIRQSVLISLGAIEDYIGVERTIKPQRKKQ